ncbi:MAG: histidine phosphatase family protein [Acetatifactor sp.]|nr:histidine phosphatase family protein [Acetatifactor sp.]MDE7355084.1 histidine phosphatase family protein [Acetatifactor sp.]
MDIYLMRHGETDWNKSRRLQGQSDIPLNMYGVELAEKTAAALEDIPFDQAFSSPLHRACETARIIIGSRPIPLYVDERLKEIGFGEYEGACFDRAKEDPQDPLHDFFRRPDQYIPPAGAESFDQVRSRGFEFFREKILPLEGSCRNVLIVAHGAFNRTMVNSIAGIPPEEFWRIGLPNCAVSILSLEQGSLSVQEESRIYYGAPVNERP